MQQIVYLNELQYLQLKGMVSMHSFTHIHIRVQLSIIGLPLALKIIGTSSTLHLYFSFSSQFILYYIYSHSIIILSPSIFSYTCVC